jgi:hypothetical protein
MRCLAKAGFCRSSSSRSTQRAKLHGADAIGTSGLAAVIPISRANGSGSRYLQLSAQRGEGLLLQEPVFHPQRWR